jgi:hypothetical protein
MYRYFLAAVSLVSCESSEYKSFEVKRLTDAFNFHR